MKAHFLPTLPYNQAMIDRKELVRFGNYLNYSVVVESNMLNIDALSATGLATPNEVSVMRVKDEGGLEYLVFMYKGKLYFSINHTLDNWCVYFKNKKPKFVNRFKPIYIDNLEGLDMIV